MKNNAIYCFYCKIFHRKEKKFQILLWVSLFLGICFAFQIWGKASQSLRTILPRTPLVENDRILLQISKKILAQEPGSEPLFTKGSPLYQYNPDLVLLGEVEKVVEEDSDSPDYATLYIGIFPHYRNKVMRKQSQFKIFKESPSFYFISQNMLEKRTIPIFDLDFLSARNLENKALSKEDDIVKCFERNGISLSDKSSLKVIRKGQEWLLKQNEEKSQDYPILVHERQGDKRYYVYGKIHQRAQIIARNSQSSYRKVLEIFGEKLKQHGSPHAKRIVEDPVIQEYIFQALNNEVLSKIDSKKIATSLSNNPNTKKIFQNVDWSEVFQSVSKSFLTGAADTLQEKATQGIEKTKTPLGKILTVGYNLAWGYLFQRNSLKETLKGGGTGALGQSFEEMGKIIKQNPELSKKVGKDLLKEIELADKFGYGLQALFQNKEFTDYVKKNYGEDSLKIFQNSCYDMIGLPEVKQTLESLKYQLEESAAFITSSIVLNDKKDGINPALLVFVRERLLQSKEPQIVFLEKEKPDDATMAKDSNPLVPKGYKYFAEKSVTEFDEN